ncbi:hypothetical protein G6F22_009018 [Rhizopus arrhizus]|nr:hypothetical protein G6F22_009018 [Rhizopus arrhizus]
MPSDVSGHAVYDPKSESFKIRRGPVFTNLLLADEINRAPAKTQSALLEVMQEGQVTIEGKAFTLAPPFMALATQNPLEQEGTYPLPEAQLDRFLLKVLIDYPQLEDEKRMVTAITSGRAASDFDLSQVPRVLGAGELLELQRATAAITVDDEVIDYAVRIVAATRQWPGIAVGAGPRGSIALVRASRAQAVLAGRDFVTPDDVRDIARPALRHRIALAPELQIEGQDADDAVPAAAGAAAGLGRAGRPGAGRPAAARGLGAGRTGHRPAGAVGPVAAGATTFAAGAARAARGAGAGRTSRRRTAVAGGRIDDGAGVRPGARWLAAGIAATACAAAGRQRLHPALPPATAAARALPLRRRAPAHALAVAAVVAAAHRATGIGRARLSELRAAHPPAPARLEGYRACAQVDLALIPGRKEPTAVADARQWPAHAGQRRRALALRPCIERLAGGGLPGPAPGRCRRPVRRWWRAPLGGAAARDGHGRAPAARQLRPAAARGGHRLSGCRHRGITAPAPARPGDAGQQRARRGHRGPAGSRSPAAATPPGVRGQPARARAGRCAGGRGADAGGRRPGRRRCVVPAAAREGTRSAAQREGDGAGRDRRRAARCAGGALPGAAGTTGTSPWWVPTLVGTNPQRRPRSASTNNGAGQRPALPGTSPW